MEWELQYAGNNYGQFCGDGTYIEGGLTCACQCTPANKCLGSPCDVPGGCEVGNPISLATGNKYEEVADYHTAGINPLTFTRYYNSLGSTNTRAAMLGGKWRSTYDRFLRPVSSNNVITAVVAERADGQEVVFTPNSGGWMADSDVDIKLALAGANWIITNTDDSIEFYNATGALTSIQARDGYTQTLQYGGNQLSSVTDSFGRTLQFSYDGNLLHAVTTPDGLVLTYGYNSSGQTPGVLDRLAYVTYSTTPQSSQSYLYENSVVPFGLTGIIDENGNRFATWTYDATGRALSSQHAGGADLTTVAYNDSDGSRSVTNALGLVMVYRFETLQNVPKVYEIDRQATATVPAARMTFSYDNNGYLTFVTDWKNTDTSIANDVHGQPLTVNEAFFTSSSRQTTLTYLTNFHLPAQIIPPRETTTFIYDNNGNALTRTETDTSSGTTPYSTTGQTRTWTNTFDGLGHVLTVTGQRTDVTATSSFAYDSSNNLNTIIDPLGHITQLTNYNGSGLPLTMIDPNGVVTALTYDARDRLLTRTVQAASGNATTAFSYDAAGQVTNITLPDGLFLNYQYDLAHRLQSVSDGLGESIAYSLDAAGNVTNQTVRNAQSLITKTQNQVFDQLGRMLQQIGAASQTTSYGYDGDDNRISIKDGLANATARSFDALNRLITVIDPLTNTSSYGYDLQDNLVSVTDPRALVTSYVYDGFRHVIQESNPDKGTTVYFLDKAGNRTNETDARGVITQRVFDKLDRVISKTFPASPGENISYTYDATNGGNFGIGHLTGYTDETGSTTLTYNERGDVVSTTRTIGGIAYTTGYGYDLADHVSSITYPSGHVITYGRDSQGRISSVAYQSSHAGASSVLASNVTYAPFGPLSQFIYGNGMARTQSYDQDYRLAGIATSVAGANVQNLGLGYDAVNDITNITDNLLGALNQTFSYDRDYRLMLATGIYGTTRYGYDADGNRLTRNTGGATENYNYSSTANVLLSTVKSGVTRSFAHTSNGDLSDDNHGTATNMVFSYGNRNRYSTLTIGGSLTATYKYNAPGERLIKSVGSVTTHYHFDENGHLIAESQSSGAMIREYVWLDDMPLAQIESSGAIYYIHPDHLNRPQKMTDSTGAVVWDDEQQPFGEPLPPALASIGYNTNKQFQAMVSSGPNIICVVQGSTNLSGSNWVSLTTNAGTFTFTDTNAANYRARFYRVLYVPNPAGVTQNLRFPGQYFDAESGLDYNMMRDYDPTLGRYIQSDLIGLRGGINLYGYAKSAPTVRKDTLGLQAVFMGEIPPLIPIEVPPEDIGNLTPLPTGPPPPSNPNEPGRQIELPPMSPISGTLPVFSPVNPGCSASPNLNSSSSTGPGTEEAANEGDLGNLVPWPPIPKLPPNPTGPKREIPLPPMAPIRPPNRTT